MAGIEDDVKRRMTEQLMIHLAKALKEKILIKESIGPKKTSAVDDQIATFRCLKNTGAIKTQWLSQSQKNLGKKKARNDAISSKRSRGLEVNHRVPEMLLSEDSSIAEPTTNENVLNSFAFDLLSSTCTELAKKPNLDQKFKNLSPITSSRSTKLKSSDIVECGISGNLEKDNPENDYSDISSNLELNTNFTNVTYSRSTRAKNASKSSEKTSLDNFNDEKPQNSRHGTTSMSNKTFMVDASQSSRCSKLGGTSASKMPNIILNETYSIESSHSVQEDLIDLNIKSIEVVNNGYENQSLLELSKSQETSNQDKENSIPHEKFRVAGTPNEMVDSNVVGNETYDGPELSTRERHRSSVWPSQMKSLGDVHQEITQLQTPPENINPTLPLITPADPSHYQTLVEKDITRKSEGVDKVLHNTGVSSSIREPSFEDPDIPEESPYITNTDATSVSVSHRVSSASRSRRRSSKSVTFCKGSFLQKDFEDKSENTRRSQIADFTTVTPCATLSVPSSVDETVPQLKTPCGTLTVVPSVAVDTVTQFVDTLPFEVTKQPSKDTRAQVCKCPLNLGVSFLATPKTREMTSPKGAKSSDQLAVNNTADEITENLGNTNYRKDSSKSGRSLVSFLNSTDIPVGEINDKSVNKTSVTDDKSYSVQNPQKPSLSKSLVDSQVSFLNSKKNNEFSAVADITPAAADKTKKSTAENENFEVSCDTPIPTNSSAATQRKTSILEEIQKSMTKSKLSTPGVGFNSQETESRNNISSANSNLEKSIGMSSLFTSPSAHIKNAPVSERMQPENGEPSPLIGHIAGIDIDTTDAFANQGMNALDDIILFKKTLGEAKAKSLSCPSLRDVPVVSTDSGRTSGSNNVSFLKSCLSTSMGKNVVSESRYNEINNDFPASQQSVSKSELSFTRALLEGSKVNEISSEAPKNETERELNVYAKNVTVDIGITVKKRRSDVKNICLQTDDNNHQADTADVSLGTGTQTSFCSSGNSKRRKTVARQSFGMQTTERPNEFATQRKSFGMQTTKRFSKSPSHKYFEDIGVQNSPWQTQSQPVESRRSSFFRESYRSFGCHTEFPQCGPVEEECLDLDDSIREITETMILPKKVTSAADLRGELMEAESQLLKSKCESIQNCSISSRLTEGNKVQKTKESAQNIVKKSRPKSDPVDNSVSTILRQNRRARGAQSSDFHTQSQNRGKAVSTRSSAQSRSKRSSKSKSRSTSSKRSENVTKTKVARLSENQGSQAEASRENDSLRAGLKNLGAQDNYELIGPSINKGRKLSKPSLGSGTSKEITDSASKKKMPLPRCLQKSVSVFELSLDPNKNLFSSTRITSKAAKKHNRLDVGNDRPVYYFIDDETNKPIYVPLDYELNYVISAEHHHTKNIFPYYSRGCPTRVMDIEMIKKPEMKKLQYLVVNLRSMLSPFLEMQKSSSYYVDFQTLTSDISRTFSKARSNWAEFIKLFLKQKLRRKAARRWIETSVFYGGTNGDKYAPKVDGLDLMASFCAFRFIDASFQKSQECREVMEDFTTKVTTLIIDIKNTNSQDLIVKSKRSRKK